MSLTKFGFLFSCAAVLAILAGCTFAPSSISGKLPVSDLQNLRNLTMLSKREIMSRSWQDESGTLLELIDFRLEPMGKSDLLAIAKFGEKSTFRVRCIDFYEYRPTRDPSGGAFFLLCHDFRDGSVADIHIERGELDVIIRIERNGRARDGSEKVINSYAYVYHKGKGISPTVGDFVY